MKTSGRPNSGGSSEDYGAVRPTTPWWLWAVAVFLTAAVVFGLLDALNTPAPGGVVFPYVVR